MEERRKREELGPERWIDGPRKCVWAPSRTYDPRGGGYGLFWVCVLIVVLMVALAVVMTIWGDGWLYYF